MPDGDTQTDATTDLVPLRHLLRPLKEPMQRKWKLVTSTILAGWGKFLLPMSIPLLTAYLIDNVLSEPPTADTPHTLLIWLAIAVGLITIIATATYFRTALAQRLAAYVQHQLRKRLFYHIQRLSLAFFHKHHAGSLGSRVSSDITYAGVVIDKGVIQLSIDGMTFIAMAIAMMWLNPILGSACLCIFVCKALVVRYYGPSIRRQRKSIQESQSSVTGQAAEIFSAISVVKAFAGERASGKVFTASSRHVRELQDENSRLQGSFQGISHGLLYSAQVCVLILGGYLVLYHPSSLTTGELVGFMMLVNMINGNVQRLIDAMIQIQDGFAALERIHDILGVLPTPADHDHATEPALAGRIDFQHVTFGYNPAEPVLHDFNFSFTAGKTYALVGASGSGKSTMTQLMLRFYDPNSGQVLIDGHPLDHIKQSHFRSQVAAVLQDPIIFSTSVRDNIGFASEDATDADVRAAAERAQAAEFIDQLPDGFDTPLGERGVALSGGQRQRIAIARALMRDPKVLILDEATSALDSMTERSIQEVVDHLQGSRTVIIIAHRLSTIRNVDEILVIDQGRLAEHGSYDELMQAGGAFARLAAEQKDSAA